jgi:hypothetical protein
MIFPSPQTRFSKLWERSDLLPSGALVFRRLLKGAEAAETTALLVRSSAIKLRTQLNPFWNNPHHYRWTGRVWRGCLKTRYRFLDSHLKHRKVDVHSSNIHNSTWWGRPVVMSVGLSVRLKCSTIHGYHMHIGVRGISGAALLSIRLNRCPGIHRTNHRRSRQRFCRHQIEGRPLKTK